MHSISKILAALLCILLAASPAGSGSMLLLGAGKAPVGGAAFVGMGDVKTGSWTAAWGARAFTSATRGNKLINVCNSTGGTDVGCADMLSDASTGNLVPQTISGLPCPAANCTIKTYYDISGQSNCTGSPCDLTQATIANRAVLTANAIGSKTCGVGNGTTIVYSNSGFGTLAQPLTISAVAKYASNVGANLYFGAGGGGGNGFGIVGSNFAFYSSSTVNGTAADTSAHAFQSVDNSASSTLTVDTTTSSVQNSGGTTLTTTLYLFSDPFAQAINGALCEVGVFPAAFSGTDISNMNANQHSYWGF